MFQGYKTLIGAIMVGFTTSVKNLEDSGMLLPGTLETGISIVNGLGWFLSIYGLGDKMQRWLGVGR